MTAAFQLSSPDNFLENRIIDLPQDKPKVNRKRLSLSSRIVEDLQVDGDDATEFFQAFQMAFPVDLVPLWASWNRYFHQQRRRGRPLHILILLLASVALAILFHAVIRLVPAWVWTLVLMAVSMFKIVPLFGGRPLPAITLQDLVDAARAGRWVKVVAQDDEGSR